MTRIVLHLVGGVRIQSGRRLVQEEDTGVGDERDADVDALRLAAADAACQRRPDFHVAAPLRAGTQQPSQGQLPYMTCMVDLSRPADPADALILSCSCAGTISANASMDLRPVPNMSSTPTHHLHFMFAPSMCAKRNSCSTTCGANQRHAAPWRCPLQGLRSEPCDPTEQ